MVVRGLHEWAGLGRNRAMLAPPMLAGIVGIIFACAFARHFLSSGRSLLCVALDGRNGAIRARADLNPFLAIPALIVALSWVSGDGTDVAINSIGRYVAPAVPLFVVLADSLPRRLGWVWTGVLLCLFTFGLSMVTIYFATWRWAG